MIKSISIHAPLRERHGFCRHCFDKTRFQSTLPCGSDKSRAVMLKSWYNFNPRSLAGATSSSTIIRHRRSDFNPRSLAGATSSVTVPLAFSTLFQSTLPCGSDAHLGEQAIQNIISIHAPLRERQLLKQF